jgi:excisionase family DNA binding protein
MSEQHAEAVQTSEAARSGTISMPFELRASGEQVSNVLASFAGIVERVVAERLAWFVEQLPKPQQATTQQKPQAATFGVALSEAERFKAADLRTALLVGKVPENTGLLVDAKTAAALLDISPRTLLRLHDEKAIPAAVRIGRLVRWRLTELLEWIDSGCPHQRYWKYPSATAIRPKTRR